MLTAEGRIAVMLNGARTDIDKAVFVSLLENSVASTYVAYEKAIKTSSIKFSELVELARHGEIPYTLFFAPLSLVEVQIKAKTNKLLSGLSKETFSVNSRETVNLRDIELIVKDLLRKQELLKKHDSTLVKNSIVGLLKKSTGSVEGDAIKLMSALGVTCDALSSVRTKEAALALLILQLEANQVLVSQSVNNFMPQRLVGVKFSGMTIKDAKVPYIFLAGGDSGDQQEPTGRKVFTLALMSVLVARSIFAPVTYDGQSVAPVVGREYDIAGEMLMPSVRLRDTSLVTLDEVKIAADEFKVTPSAITVRGMRLGLIGRVVAKSYLRELAQEFASRPKARPRQPKAVNAIRKYNGSEFSKRMLSSLDAGNLSPKEFCRSVCLKRIGPGQIGEFREALR